MYENVPQPIKSDYEKNVKN
ncbi:hypothetical protein [Clostridioides difficile]